MITIPTITNRCSDKGKEDGWYDRPRDVAVPVRPIVVGYAFGPKKMKTMGLIMAEASKAKVVEAAAAADSTWTTTDGGAPWSTTTTTTTPHHEPPSLSGVSQQQQQQQQPYNSQEALSAATDDFELLVASDNNSNKSESIVFTFDGCYDLTFNSAGERRPSSLEHIIRHFQSSCSSIGDAGSTGTCTAASTTTSRGTYLSSATTTTTITNAHMLLPRRVSFVPLDLDQPLQDQHGGSVDIILHKLTEDILTTSIFAKTCWQLQNLARIQDEEALNEILTNERPSISLFDQSAIRRVFRLIQYQRDHANSCKLIIDDPLRIQKVMSRADIAYTLKNCLQNIFSASRIPVDTPPFAVVGEGYNENIIDLQSILDSAGLQFPIIVKPLTAAGTKASHAMAVVMDLKGLRHVLDEMLSSSLSTVAQPHLLQQYCNHDAFLYKVYVLGDHVSVHRRRSLPNLPKAVECSRRYVEFDSQRPFPRLVDFGVQCPDSTFDCVLATPPTSKIHLTAEEVQPVVDSLRNAFGLELFGFDILVTSAETNCAQVDIHSCGDDDVMVCSGKNFLVVDVNYFPSYKEVTNFPILLAKYLTDRATDDIPNASASNTEVYCA